MAILALERLTFQCLEISASWLRERRAAEALSTSCAPHDCSLQQTLDPGELAGMATKHIQKSLAEVPPGRTLVETFIAA